MVIEQPSNMVFHNGNAYEKDGKIIVDCFLQPDGYVLEALQSAYELSTGTMKGRMEELTGGLNLNLPGLGG